MYETRTSSHCFGGASRPSAGQRKRAFRFWKPNGWGSAGRSRLRVLRAVYNATGKRIRKLPVTRGKLIGS
jgi:hypothetical protein